MKAKEGILDLLNRVLTENLTAINQYFVHAKMCENWGYERLHDHVRKRSFDEMKDAEEIIEHILYLDGVPNMQRLGTVQVGETVPEQFKLDLKTEFGMLNLYAEGRHTARRLEISRLATCLRICKRILMVISTGLKNSSN